MYLGRSFGSRGSAPAAGGFSSSTTGEPQKFSYPNNQCPAGYQQTGSGADRPPQGYSSPWGNYVLCRPGSQPSGPVAPAPAPAPITNITTTVSPVIQNEASPQISPVTNIVQDSPGSTQTSTPAQISQGGQSADTGGGGSNDAVLAFLQQQAELDAQRRQEETAARELERQEREAREAEQRALDNQRAEAEAARLAAESEARLELQRLQIEAQAAAEAGRAEEAAALQAQYNQQLEEWQRTSAQPSTFISQPSASAPLAPASISASNSALPSPPTASRSNNVALIAGLVAVAAGGYFLTRKKKK